MGPVIGRGSESRKSECLRAFHEAFPDEEFVQQVVSQLPWDHNVKLIEALKAPEERLLPVRQSNTGGLAYQIESGPIYGRERR
ncbi:DUF1016 N-terminal domain-containing protein [Ensifer sp. 4252]|uniref:DUF1016 N-terminal domain-containing protein n=1 Tax=Ensifer sp. 4252 TaxID=3373915 RepID=UPI003D1D4CB3